MRTAQNLAWMVLGFLVATVFWRPWLPQAAMPSTSLSSRQDVPHLDVSASAIEHGNSVVVERNGPGIVAAESPRSPADTSSDESVALNEEPLHADPPHKEEDHVRHEDPLPVATESPFASVATVADSEKCRFKGASLPCKKKQRDSAWHALERTAPSHCGKGATHERALLSKLEPLFTGIDFPKNQKAKWVSHPKLLAAHGFKPKCKEGTRCIYIDLGARSFHSTVSWFLQNYPEGDSFDVHAFDMDPRWAKEYENKNRIHFHMAAVSDTEGSLEVSTQKRIVHGKPQMMDLTKAASNDKHTIKIPVHNLIEWLRTHTDENDFVVLKFDIEGVEHQLIPILMSTGMIGRVDELMLECHYQRGDADCKKHGEDFCIPRSECLRMLQKLRDMCIYTHEWT
eukprot:TRINITY_DN10429_c0_g1_i1.p1 TRINITY_DN10429_c0_g1~~TRINITY_DN10429_c0_g1_i1.p1  ORF type:complete len:398 (+),score=48.29 TRINITY_DN10429_c0_g1_i1:52-1245(+)